MMTNSCEKNNYAKYNVTGIKIKGVEHGESRVGIGGRGGGVFSSKSMRKMLHVGA